MAVAVVVCVYIYTLEGPSLTCYWLLSYLHFSLQDSGFLPASALPSCVNPASLRPTLSFQNSSSSIMTAVTLTALRCAWVEFLCFLSSSVRKGSFQRKHNFSKHEFCRPLPIQTSLLAPVKCWAIGSCTKGELYLVNQNRSSLTVPKILKPSLFCGGISQVFYHLVLRTARKGRVSWDKLLPPLRRLTCWGAERWGCVSRIRGH